MTTMVRERGILFSGPMVRACLRDVDPKTQTRRVMSLPDFALHGVPSNIVQDGGGNWIAWYLDPPAKNARERRHVERFTKKAYPNGEGFVCPYGAPGDRLWVRETWQDFCPIWDGAWCGHATDDGMARDHLICYCASDKGITFTSTSGKLHTNVRPLKWKPAIHMPRWASRITLEITGVRVERLNDISEADAIAEGVDAVSQAEAPRNGTWSRQQDFAQLWDRINGKRHPWASNCWVWVIEFRRIPRPSP